MVSFWPWKGENNSPASFEKILSNLSAKISKTGGRLDGLRKRSRRLRVLWTLYAGFAYLLCSIILILIVGWRKWGLVEYTAVAGGPVVIYIGRLALTTYYEYRTSSIQSRLDELQKQRDSTIEKLKAATKYNDTQDLLTKYGGTPTPKAKLAGLSERKPTPKPRDTPTGGTTTVVPPPTANIPGRNGTAILTNTPQRSISQIRSPLGQGASYPASGATAPTQGPLSPLGVSAEFAPNAFSAAPQYAQAHEGSRWYDRIMDVLLGEDETLPRARLALICSSCRLVNGQAPPGVKRLEDVGKWRCGSCGATNGEESEAKEIVASIKEQASFEERQPDKGEEDDSEIRSRDVNDDDAPASQEDDNESDVTQYSSETSKSMQRVQKKRAKLAEPENPKRRSTRSKASGTMAN
ncbi:MAG: hypothetical protein ASARMPREDX12_009251 [Alectoria sarmentosa]|nr:MAG: hypothetical protein ASARMPREDX12_009251 [Alectoria sarmentosa]